MKSPGNVWAGGRSASAVAYGSDFAIPVQVGVCPPPHQPSPGSAGVPPASCPCQRFLPRRGLRLSQLKWPSPTACPRMPQAVPQVEPFWIGLIEGFLGARASRPHNDWRGLGHLLHLDRPAAAPRLSFGLAVAVTADVVAACKAARKLSDHHKEQDAGGTPALPGDACAIHSWFTHKPQTWFTRLVFVKWG